MSHQRVYLDYIRDMLENALVIQCDIAGNRSGLG
jgi:hypothetical protein